jgi:uncharacterized membrane protein YphA (DoxX/SURF4 family)
MFRPTRLEFSDYLRMGFAHDGQSLAVTPPSGSTECRYTAAVPEPEVKSPRVTSWQLWVTLAARLILGVTLVVAGAIKITALDQSVAAVRAYNILPFEVTAVVGSALPIIEIAVGVLLVVGAFTRVSAIVGSLLMLSFIIAIATVWIRGQSIDCGCFGNGGAVAPSQTEYPIEIARDLGLFLLGAWTVWRPKAPFSADFWLFAPTDEFDDDVEDGEDGPNPA